MKSNDPYDDPRADDWQPEHGELDNWEAGSIDGNPDDPQRFPDLEDAPAGYIQVDLDKTERVGSGPDDESLSDLLDIGTNGEVVMDDIQRYTDDQDVLEDFAERQEMPTQSEELLEMLREHHAVTPGVSANDVDADWQRADQVGEEGVGATVPTPDQDVVDELGEAWGIRYRDNEPLATGDMLVERDTRRWELDPASANDEDRESDDLGLDGDTEDELQVDEIDLDDLDDDFLLGGVDLDDEDY